MMIKSNRRILILVLILTSLIYILPWEGTSTLFGGFKSNFYLPHTLDAESRHNRPQAAARALSQLYVSHERISIMNNTDFATLGFPGAGTSSNPYIIEGLNITSSAPANEVLRDAFCVIDACVLVRQLIHIQDTTAHFRIRNNLLTGSRYGVYGDPAYYYAHALVDDGISLKNVKHGAVDTNIVTNCARGIHLYSSEQINVSHNTVSNTKYRGGISLVDSWNNKLAHNTLSHNNSIGISLEKSGQNTVTYNTGTISLLESTHNTVTHNTGTISITGSLHFEYDVEGGVVKKWVQPEAQYNTVTHNTGTISLSGSEYNTISYNTGDWAVISLSRSGQNTLIENRNTGLIISGDQIEDYLQEKVADNLVNGRPLIYWQQVSGRTVPPGAGQIILINTKGVEVTGQNLSRASIGVYAYKSKNLKIHHNTVANNSQAGIFLDNCVYTYRYADTWTKVAHNTVTQNTIGILLVGGNRIKVIRNTVTQNTIGIHRKRWDQPVPGNKSLLNKIAHNTVANNTDCGIVLSGSELSTVFNNTVSYSEIGIRLEYSEQNTISNNTVVKNTNGIGLNHGSEQNTLAYNTLSHNTNGIVLEYTGQNTFANNTLSHNKQDGIQLICSDQNIVIHNIISHNPRYGIHIRMSRNTTVVHNNVFNCDGAGIFFSNSWNTTLNSNNLFNNKDGIAFNHESEQNIVAHNIISHNRRYGIILASDSGYNTMKRNDFLGNGPGDDSQARDDGSNNTFAHNYWDDHDNTDLNDDRIADTLYPIAGAAANHDPFPLATTCTTPHTLSAPTITYPNGGETLQGTVMLHWATAIDELEHSITYTILYSVDGGSTWTPLASGLSTATYEWDTTMMVESPTYLIRVVATCSEGLTAEDVSDASFTIQNSEATATSLPPVGVFPTTGGPVGMLLVSLILVMILIRRVKRKSR